MSCNNYQQKVGTLFQSIADLLTCVPLGHRCMSLVARFSNGIEMKGVRMSTILRIDQKVTLSPGFTDAAGNAVTELGSVPVWTISDPAIASLEVSVDGLSAIVRSTGVLGTAQINMTVDADPDDDVEEIVGTMDLEFKAGKARFVALSAVVADADVAPEAP